MAGAGGAYVPRHTPHDSELRRRVEPVAPRRAPPRRIPVTRKPAPRVEAFNGLLERNLLTISGVLLLIGIAGWSVALYNQIHGSGLLGGDATSVRAGATIPSAAVTKSNPDFSAYIRTATDAATFAPSSGGTPLVTGSFGGGEAASSSTRPRMRWLAPPRASTDSVGPKPPL